MDYHPVTCPHADPTCPCQDGDCCHYESYPARDGWPESRALPDPRCNAEHAPPEGPSGESLMRELAVLRTEVAQLRAARPGLPRFLLCNESTFIVQAVIEPAQGILKRETCPVHGGESCLRWFAAWQPAG